MGVVKNIYTDIDLKGNELKNFRVLSLDDDPEVLDGGIYYNTKLKEFRFCIAGKWVNIFGGWYFDEEGNLCTDKTVIIDNNLIVTKDTSSGGEGQDTPAEGTVTGIEVNGTPYEPNTQGVIDLSAAFNAIDVSDQLKDYYTKTQTDSAISAAIEGLNVGQYAKKDSLDALQAEVDNIDTVLGIGETAEGYINTWAEVVAFLDAIEQEEDLASILETMNTNIGKNATGIESLATRVKAEEDVTETYKEWWADLKKWVTVEDGNVKISTNLIVSGDTSSGGSGEDTPASGTVTGIKVSATQTLEPNSAGVIDMVSTLASIDVSDQLTAYAKTADVNSALALKQDTISDLATIRSGAASGTTALQSITKSMVDSVLDGTTSSNANKFLMCTGSTTVWSAVTKSMVASALGASTGGRYLIDTGGDVSWGTIPTKLSQFTDDVVRGKYLPLVGGVISGSNFSPLHIKSSAASYAGLGLRLSGSTYSAYFLYKGDTTWAVTGENWTNEMTLLHSGNYSSYALPKSGGTISSDSYAPLTLDTTNTQCRIAFKVGGTDKALVGYNPNYGSWLYNYASGAFISVYDDGTPHYNNYTLIHSGNIESQKVAGLVTPRTIWGQSFDGTGNVSGNLYLGTGTILSSKSGTDRVFLDFGSAGDPYIGYGTSSAGIDTHICGNNIYLRYGTSRTSGLILNSSGNVTIGGSDLAGTTYKMSVDGKVHIRSTMGASMNEGAGSLIVGNGAVLMIDANDIQAKTNGTTAGPLYLNDWGGNVILCGQNNGNVLIGLATDSGQRFQVNGNVRIYDNVIIGTSNSESGRLRLVGKSGDTNVLVVADYNGQTKFRVQNDGSANFAGAVTMSSALSVKQGVTAHGQFLLYTTDDAYRLTMYEIDNIARLYNIDSAGQAYGDMYIGQNSTGAIVIKGGSYVGVGATPSGSYKFEVDGNVGIGNSYDCHLYLRRSGINYIDANGSLRIMVNGYATKAIDIESNGAVTMSNTLSVTGDSYWYNNAFFGAGKEGIYISSTGQSIAWHNTSNSYVDMLIGFTASSISVYQNLLPDANNSLSLGTSSYQWSTIYGVNGIFSGDTSSGSDIRFKDIIKNKTLKIEDIAKAPLFTFKWNDRDDDAIHLGSSAQYWEKVCPWLVTGEDFKSLNYATLGVAMGISLAKKAVNHEERIEELERKVKSLEEENRRLRYGN